MINDQYFVNHYSHVNSIDPHSEASIRRWLDVSRAGYALELDRYYPDPKGKKFLELGCGLGGTINYLRTKGASEILGVDHSADQLAVCRKYVSENVVQSDVIEYLRSTEERFDEILGLDLIEHLPKDSVIEFVTLLKRVLKPGGRILIRTPNMGALFGLRIRYIDFTHETGFTEESIAQVLRTAGFRNISVNNAYMGKKRMFAVWIFQRMLERLYNIRFSSVVTLNLIVTAGNE